MLTPWYKNYGGTIRIGEDPGVAHTKGVI